MKILIFNNQNTTIDKKIRHALKTFPECQVIVTKDHLRFRRDFSLCLSGETIVIFFITSESDMVFLESMHSNFVDIKLIANLSKRKKAFQSRVLKLNPRIITNSDENPDLLLGSIQGIVKEKLKNQPENDESL